ncbi:MAG: transporter associated domain-containing protein, partial [Acetobacterales bacterium]
EVAAVEVHAEPRRRLDRLPLPEGAELISVVRDGTVHTAAALEQLSPEDCVLVMAPAESIPILDRLFGAKAGHTRTTGDPLGVGEFPFSGDTRLGVLAELYGFAIPRPLYDTTAGAFLKRYLPGRPAAGRHLCIGDVELIVREVADGAVTQVALSLLPERRPTARAEAAYVWLRAHVLERAQVAERAQPEPR